MATLLDRWFGLSWHGTNLRREILGGVTTFATMAYIIIVNPAILANAGIDRDAGTLATILAAIFGTLLMGLYANRPIAVAPYMGENAFIAFGLAAYGIGWQERLGTVFVSGMLFLVLAITGLRVWLANAIPASLKHSFAAGIGLFLMLVGFTQAGLISVNNADAPLKIGEWGMPQLLTIAGCILMAWLLHLRLPGAILISMSVIAGAGVLAELATAPDAVIAPPWDYELGKIAGQLDIQAVFRLDLAPVLFTLFLMSFLDTLGTLYALGAAGNMLDEHGRFPEAQKPMIVDALACMFSALVGTSTSGAFIESATGIREGARTGLAAVVTALCFAAALFFVPLLGPVQELKFAYAPALIIVGILMMGALRRLDFEDLSESVPAVASVALMVFTMNIANGLAAGLVLYPLLKILTGRCRRIHPGTALLGCACACYYLFGKPH